MNDFVKTINKYVILLIIDAFFGIAWFYIRYWLFDISSTVPLLDSIPTIIDYVIRIIIITMLVSDFKKYNLKNALISCLGALFFPLLGVVIFSIMYILKEKASA